MTISKDDSRDDDEHDLSANFPLRNLILFLCNKMTRRMAWRVKEGDGFPFFLSKKKTNKLAYLVCGTENYKRKNIFVWFCLVSVRQYLPLSFFHPKAIQQKCVG